MNRPFRYDDQDAVMAELGTAVPVIMREAIESGFHAFVKSRNLDPVAHADYTTYTLRNALIDRISPIVRELVDIQSAADDRVTWKIGSNLRATEVYVGDHIALRLKRVKRRRGRSASYPTSRQVRMRSPWLLPRGQMILPGMPTTIQPDDGSDRMWMTVAFDLDELEESLTDRSIGVESRRRFLWKWPLPELETDAIARISGPLADRVDELRQIRSA